jgi:hypothetical protein
VCLQHSEDEQNKKIAVNKYIIQNEGDRFSETFWDMTQRSWMSRIDVSEEPISHINIYLEDKGKMFFRNLYALLLKNMALCPMDVT